MSMEDAAARRAARQHVETSRLLGVDFVPISMMAGAPAAETRSARGEGGDKASRLAALRERYERESPLIEQIPDWTNIVFGDGDPDARLMFVGEAPGAEEDKQGVPFVGRAGKLLNDMISAMGLRREDVYIANILKVRPPNNRTPTPDEADADGPFLREQIEIIGPEVIVTLGRPASQYLLGSRESMGNMRGRWGEYAGVPVMPTFHPAYLLRQYTPENRKKVWSDLKQVMDRLGLETKGK